jgi:type I restriction enzyme M protein
MSKIEARLPKWLERRYELLWEEFREKQFDLDQAAELLKRKNKDKREEVPVFLSEIKKAGWLKAELDPKDSRKRNYILTSRKDIIEKVLDIESETVGRDEIERILKRAADLIRTRVDYKFILVLLFLKRVNDKWELEFDKAYKEAIEDGLTEKEAKQEAASSAYHDFDLPIEARWESIRKEVEELPAKFSKAMKVLAERNPDLRDIFDNVDFLQFASNRENAEILRQLVELFSERRLHTVSADILGDAYEWILRYFSPEKAKEGEVYTPREVIKVLVEILDPQPKESVYDPACASGGMLIVSYQHVKSLRNKKEDADKLFLYGQEANPHTLALGRMNLYIHDITNAQLAPGDTLLRPKFKEGDEVKKFDIVLANPPWNQDGYDEEVLKKGEFWHQRFGFGFSPAQSADWAWIQHMLASADKKNGRVGVVIDNGCLFRAGKEGVIRKQIVDKDLIECVILLPEKLFYNTGAPGAILVMKHNKPKDRAGKILFINATNKFQKHPDVRKLNQLGKEHIDQIVEAYKKFTDSGFSRLVSIDEIKKNDYNLSITRYVDISEASEHVDIPKTLSELRGLDDERKSVDSKLWNYIKEIGYE